MADIPKNKKFTRGQIQKLYSSLLFRFTITGKLKEKYFYFKCFKVLKMVFGCDLSAN